MGSDFEPEWCSMCTLIRDPTLNGASTAADLHWIAATSYATASLPVWTVNFDVSPRRIYLFEWASDGALSAASTGDSVCVLHDARIFDETIPWVDSPSASFVGDPHLTVRDHTRDPSETQAPHTILQSSVRLSPTIYDRDTSVYLQHLVFTVHSPQRHRRRMAARQI